MKLRHDKHMAYIVTCIKHRHVRLARLIMLAIDLAYNFICKLTDSVIGYHGLELLRKLFHTGGDLRPV